MKYSFLIFLLLLPGLAIASSELCLQNNLERLNQDQPNRPTLTVKPPVIPPNVVLVPAGRSLIRISDTTVAHIRPHLKFRDTQRAFVQKVINIRGDGVVADINDAYRLLANPESPFRKNKPTSLFVEGIPPEEIVAAAKTKAIHMERLPPSRDRHRLESFSMDHKGARYRLIICKEPGGCRYKEGWLKENEIRTMYPICGDGVYTLAAKERAIKLLRVPGPLTVESFLQTTPCTPWHYGKTKKKGA